MELDSYWEADNHEISGKMFSQLWNPKDHSKQKQVL
jgi:hypothetical protein